MNYVLIPPCIFSPEVAVMIGMYKSGSRLYGLRRRRRIVQSGTSCADMPADAYHPARLPVTTLPIV